MASRWTSLKAGEQGAIIVNQTPFYAESGGQTGDHGVIKTAAGAVFTVTETLKRAGDVWAHVGNGGIGRHQGRRSG